MAATLFERRSLTEKGRALIAKAQSGRCVIELTKATTGAGLWSASEEIQAAEALKDEKQQFSFSRKEIPEGNDSTVLLTVIISNEGLEQLYHLGEMGIWANDPDDGEVLYAILTNSTEGQYLPSDNGIGVSQIIENIALEVYNAENVVIQMSGAYAEADELRALREIVRNELRGMIGGTAGQMLQKMSSEDYVYSWVTPKSWVLTKTRALFPAKGAADTVYVDINDAGIYVWKNDEYFKLPLGADASENLQGQITQNREDIDILAGLMTDVIGDIDDLEEKFQETQVTVSASGWTTTTESGVSVYTNEISVPTMPENPDITVYPGELISSNAADIEAENEACSTFFAYGRAYGETGTLRLKCWGDKPERNFKLKLVGVG